MPMVITAPEGVTTTFTRDVYGKPKTLTRSGPGPWTDATCDGVQNTLCAVRRYVYDSQQRLCKTIEPDAGITVMGYDAAGNLGWRATGQNTTTSPTACGVVAESKKSIYTLDARNRVLGINHPNATADEAYTYDDDGALETASAGGGTWTYTYNKRRLLESESLAVDSRTFLLDWGYNARGDVSNLKYPSGLSVGFNPNAYGEARQAASYAAGAVYDPNGASTGFAYAKGTVENPSGAVYHPNGALSGFAYGNGATRAVTFNARQFPLRILDSKAGVGTVMDHAFAYDANANVGTLTDGLDARESRSLYYDDLDRLTGVSATTGEETYDYDPLDNLRQTVINGVDRRLHYDAKQRLERIATAPPASSTQLIYGWNGRGEMSLKGDYTALLGLEQRFVFDDAARLIQATGTECYRYDAHGHRTVSERCGTNSKRYQVYSRAGQLLYVDDSGDVQHTAEQVEYVYLGKTLVAERNPSTAVATYQHTDHRGTPSVESNQLAGLASLKVLLMPYGSPYDGAGVLRDGPGFTGHATNKSTGLSYMQQRYYDPVAGRFLSVDSVAAGAGSFNRYWYANNNPYTFSDPDGRWAHLVVGGVIGAVFGGGAETYRQLNEDGPMRWGEIAIETGKGAGVGVLTAAIPGSTALTFGGTAAKATVSVGAAVAVGSGGEVLAQAAKGEAVDASAALDAGLANGAGVLAGQVLAPAARALTATRIQANPGLPVTSNSGRQFSVGATPALTIDGGVPQQLLQDVVGSTVSEGTAQSQEEPRPTDKE